MLGKRTHPRARSRTMIGAVILCVVATALLAGPALASSGVKTLSDVSALAYEAVSRTFWSGTGSYASRTKVATGDVDGDGITDVLQFYRRTTTGSSVYLFKSDGAHMVKSTAWSGTRAWAKTQIAAGDYNGDGKCDLFLLYNRGGSTCSVYVMTSSGTSLSSPREIYRSGSGSMAFSRARLTAGDPNDDNLAEPIIYYESGSGHAALRVIGKGMSQVQGTVNAAQGGAALAGVEVTLYDSSGTELGSATTGADGSYTIPAALGTGYRAVFQASGYLSATYSGINVSGTGGTTLETVKLVSNSALGAGGASGFIKNALDGSALAGLNLNLRTGYNTTSGSLAGFSAVTAADGSYSFAGIPGGYYTAEITGTGFTTTYFTIVVVGGTTIGNQNMSITPVLSGSDIRLVLTWGATPNDLDSHLTGPPTSGSTRFHVFYRTRRYPTNTAQPVIAILDTDDTSSYGPETVTLSRTSGGVYRYSVHDYTNRSSTTGSTLAGSGAQVRVYQGSALVGTYNVPNRPGTLWKVLEISGNTITPVNTMSFHTADTGTIP